VFAIESLVVSLKQSITAEHVVKEYVMTAVLIQWLYLGEDGEILL
jgi:hypothetical protein